MHTHAHAHDVVISICTDPFLNTSTLSDSDWQTWPTGTRRKKKCLTWIGKRGLQETLHMCRAVSAEIAQRSGLWLKEDDTSISRQVVVCVGGGWVVEGVGC